MFRPAFRALTIAKSIPKAPSGRRYASTAASRSGTWKGAAVRWGLAGAIIYYYNTSVAFAEEPQFAAYAPPDSSQKSETYATIDSIAEQRRAQARTRSQPPQEDGSAATVAAPENAPVTSGALEEEAEQQGAFNEETGEINWDCPCLGGMANGPCGEQFRAAFSCFVYSKEEPKGVDCIEHFKTMQNCFREHPDVYGSELEDDEVPTEAAEGTSIADDAGATPALTPSAPLLDDSALRETIVATDAQVKRDIEGAVDGIKRDVKGAVEGVKRDIKRAVDGSDDLVPKAWHDDRESTTGK